MAISALDSTPTQMPCWLPSYGSVWRSEARMRCTMSGHRQVPGAIRGFQLGCSYDNDREEQPSGLG